MTEIQQAEIRVVGVVQGIGFRPFIYSLATGHNLLGYVLNTGNSAVRVVVEGDKDEIIDFIESIENKKPHLAVIDSIRTIWHPPTGEYTNFQIRISKDEQKAGGSVIPSDIAICNDCIKDMQNPKSRHYQYPMTCCAICGPRYTTVTDTPYDRERTTMDDFPLCDNCEAEFLNPIDRRYNAQTICCPTCGPQFQLLESDGSIVDTTNVFEKTVNLLNDGAIVAIKGLGGIHLAVMASLEDQITRLRMIRKKPRKPLAIMSPDLNTIRQYAEISDTAEQLLCSWRRPIVVLKKSQPFPLAPSLAPGLDTIGVMLPYSGIYLRLFEGLNDLALVMTSANPSGLPTIIQASTYQKQFMEMADYFLTHNRTIYQRCDDSVVIPIYDRGLIIRRSRGFTPEPIETAELGPSILSLGALEKNTGTIYQKKRIFMTQHIGDVDTIETLEFLKDSLSHLQKLLRVSTFEAIACDLHPDFLTTEYGEKLAQEQEIPLVKVQHHHAHLASLLADFQLPSTEEIIAICCDGAGFGNDNTIWGGEILRGCARNFHRTAHLELHPMPGGDLAANYPLRMLIGILSKIYSPTELYNLFENEAQTALSQGSQELGIAIQQINQNINTPLTSSTGRVLDALSALLGVSYFRSYEGQPAIEFEAYANMGNMNSQMDFEIPVKQEGSSQVLITSALIDHIMNLRKKFKGQDLAYASHQILGKGLANLALDSAQKHGLKKIGFSGGVAYNRILTTVIRETIEAEGYTFLMHRYVPPGDAGTSVGQSLVARAMIQ